MRSTCFALLLLLAYLILVFLAFRFIDIVLLYSDGVSSIHVVDPFLLSVRQLKQLLEIRGVSYTGYVEKQELASLVEASADVIRGEIEDLNDSIIKTKDKLAAVPRASYFTGSANFYEEVEDTKDSVWLVQVVPTKRSEPLLDDYTWTLVRNQVAPFAIRTGIFDCRLDPSLCISKGWTTPLLLLAMPRGTKPKDKVIMRTCHLTRPNAIIEWLREQLSVRVRKISSLQELEKDWLGGNSTSNVDSSSESHLAVKVLLLSHLLHPPLFLAALSIKFSGRIAFGMFSVDEKEDVAKLGKVPKYLVITPGKTIVYGRRKMEHFNLKSMNAYLRAVQPEMNDSFLCSLVLVNMFAVLQFLQVNTESWLKLLVASLWTIVVANLLLFALWLTLLASLRWPLTAAFCDWCLCTVRAAALTDVGSLLRSDCVRLLRSTWLFVTSLFAFGFVACKCVSRGQSEGSSTSWWEIDCLFRPLQLQPTNPPLVEAEVSVLIEHLAVPAFWLQPSLSQEYISDLPVWKFKDPKTIISRGSAEAIEALMDSGDDFIVTSLNKGDITVRTKDVVDCAICLERYKQGVALCTLPCSHSYHQKCIFTWLYRDNHHCPICRWPAYKSKT